MASEPTTKILLVDDQSANLAVLEAILSNLAVTPVSVTSGEAALREVLAQEFAVVLLDVRMPTMNGFELARLIREHPRTQGLPIIFLTAGDAEDFPVEEAYALGAVDYMTKPFNPTVLRAKVGVFIELYRQKAELARIEAERHRAALLSREEELARSERQLGETRDRFSLLLASSGEGIFGLDQEGRCTFLNPAGADLLGYRAEELEGRALHDIIHFHAPDDDTPADGCPIMRAVRGGEALRVDEDRFTRRDGSVLPVAYSVYPMAIGGRTAGAVLTFTDITGRQQAAAERERLVRELQAANERMRDIFHRAPAFMCVMRGPQHVIELANQRYLELAGGRALSGVPVREALPELDGQGYIDVLDTVYARGEAFEAHNLRMLLKRASAGGAGTSAAAVLEEHYLDFVCMPVREPDGSVSGVLLHGVDVTERTRANLLAIGQRGALELAVTDAPLGDVLDVLARTAEDTGGGNVLASVQMSTPDGALRHAAGPSLPAAFQQAADALPIGPDAGPAGCAAWSGVAASSADVDGDPLWGALAAPMRAHGLAAARALPILAPSGQVLGTFTLYYREARAPNAQEEAAMALLANTASLVIGQRHEAAERQAAEHRSRAILESMSEGFLAVDRDWRIVYANAAAESVTRRRREDLVGGRFWEQFAALRGGPHEACLREAAAGRSARRVEAYDSAGARWFELNAFPLEAGGMALYVRDETDRRRAEEGVRRLAAVAEQSSDFIGIFAPDAGGIYLNPAGRRMAGLAPDANIAAWRMIDFFPREEWPFVREQVLGALTGAPAAWEGELRLARPDGSAPLPVYFKGFAVRDADGQTIGLATITRDITAQKRAEDELRRVAADLEEADHRKSEFLATLAHELRNPLAPIRTGLDLLRIAPRAGGAGAGADPAQARVHAMMDRQLGHLIHLVDDLLDIARITRGKIELKKEPVTVNAIVAMAVETSAALVEAHRHRLEIELPPQSLEPLELDADVTRMVQVLSNLLNNAAKYTPAGGRIHLSAWREDGHAVIAVADNGIGIPSDAIGSVFEMFTQVRGSLDRAQGGLGIGLSLVRRLVELHGGRVSAFSGGRGQGSTFTVRLPLRPGTPHARAPEAASTAAAGTPGALRVLVVDDNRDAADSLVALLGMLGHQTWVAHDGIEGLTMAHEARPDLVLLDIGLPGMSGYDVARAIRRDATLPRMVLIALTGWGGQSDQQQSQEAGFDQHMTKPVSFEALEQALATAARADLTGKGRRGR